MSLIKYTDTNYFYLVDSQFKPNTHTSARDLLLKADLVITRDVNKVIKNRYSAPRELPARFLVDCYTHYLRTFDFYRTLLNTPDIYWKDAHSDIVIEMETLLYISFSNLSTPEWRGFTRTEMRKLNKLYKQFKSLEDTHVQ